MIELNEVKVGLWLKYRKPDFYVLLFNDGDLKFIQYKKKKKKNYDTFKKH